MMQKSWVYDPHSGGIKIPKPLQERVRKRILSYAEKHYSRKYNRIEVRFRGALCYIDAYLEPDVPKKFDETVYGVTREEHIERLRNFPTHLCRLRYFGDEEKWSMAFYTYSRDKYEPCYFKNNTFHGTPEEAFKSSAMHLN